MIKQIHLWDQMILEKIQQGIANPFLDAIMPVITRLGDIGMIWILLGILLLCSKKYRKFGGILLLSLLAGTIFVNAIVKPIVARPRPFVGLPNLQLLIDPPNSYSFPSGHSLASFTGATVLSLANRKWSVPAFLIAFLIAFSRMYLYVHYLTDVFTGSILGVVFALITVWRWNRLENHRKQKLVK